MEKTVYCKPRMKTIREANAKRRIIISTLNKWSSEIVINKLDPNFRFIEVWRADERTRPIGQMQ